MATTQILDSLPVVAIFVLFVIVSLLCYEGGFRVGRWWQERTPGEQEGPTGMIVGSILALLAFLLAVTMSMASDRFDTRRAIVLDEANSIGTTYLRAGYLPEPASSQIRQLLREYVPLRIVVTDAKAADVQADIARSRRSSPRPGRSAKEVARTTDQGDLVSLLPRVAQRDDQPERNTDHRRPLRARPRDHPPAADRGFRARDRHGGLQRGPHGTSQPDQRRRPRDRPWGGHHDPRRPRPATQGFIQVSQQPLIDLQRQIGPP